MSSLAPFLRFSRLAVRSGSDSCFLTRAGPSILRCPSVRVYSSAPAADAPPIAAEKVAEEATPVEKKPDEKKPDVATPAPPAEKKADAASPVAASSEKKVSVPKLRLSGKVALITGAGSGIGRESALAFAKEGASIACVDVNDEAGQRTADLIVQNGGKALFVRADVSESADCEAMVTMTESVFGKLDILFNNAGIMHSHDDNAVTTEEDVWDLTMDINLRGVFLGCKYGIPALRRANGGTIINTASFVAFLGAATPQIAYTASKGGVVSMTRELAVIHARENIRVNALCPGPLKTELLMKFLDTEEKRKRRLVHIPMGRFGEAAEIAKAALFLASDESSFITGTCLHVDGGITAAYVTPQ